MKFSIYLDTTEKFSIGLLNESHEFIDFMSVETKKSSEIIHGKILEIMLRNKVELNDLKGLFLLSGPGSYTGMRVSEGIAQIFEWQNIKVYSFYNFEIPALSGLDSGSWVANAFKNEFYVYDWDFSKTNQRMIKDTNIITEIENMVEQERLVFTHYLDLLYDDLGVEEASYLVQSKSKIIFSKVVELGLRRSPFYFRTIEQEFKVNL